jgi:hypothetical protein
MITRNSCLRFRFAGRNVPFGVCGFGFRRRPEGFLLRGASAADVGNGPERTQKRDTKQQLSHWNRLCA